MQSHNRALRSFVRKNLGSFQLRQRLLVMRSFLYRRQHAGAGAGAGATAQLNAALDFSISWGLKCPPEFSP